MKITEITAEKKENKIQRLAAIQITKSSIPNSNWLESMPMKGYPVQV